MKQMEHQVPAAVIRAHPLIAIYYDGTIVFLWAVLTTCCQQQGKLTHTLSALMLGRKTDKGNGAEWQKKESLTHLLTW